MSTFEAKENLGRPKKNPGRFNQLQIDDALQNWGKTSQNSKGSVENKANKSLDAHVNTPETKKLQSDLPTSTQTLPKRPITYPGNKLITNKRVNPANKLNQNKTGKPTATISVVKPQLKNTKVRNMDDGETGPLKGELDLTGLPADIIKDGVKRPVLTKNTKSGHPQPKKSLKRTLTATTVASEGISQSELAENQPKVASSSTQPREICGFVGPRGGNSKRGSAKKVSKIFITLPF